MVLSERDRDVRKRIRREFDKKQTPNRDARIKRDFEILYKPIAEWDWEELSKGRPRNERGNFEGTKPTWITPLIEQEIGRRMKTMTERQIMTHAHDAIKTLTQIMMEDEVDITGKPTVAASVRVDAAKYIINRVIGTPTAHVEIESGNRLEALMGSIMVNPDGEEAHPVIEGTVVEDEDDDGGE